jgi:hypothetical protein
LTWFRAGASIPAPSDNARKSREIPVKKLGSGSRATFVSPYLRRPLRPLHKVLNERDEGDEDVAAVLSVTEERTDSGSTTWSFPRKAVIFGSK